MHAPEHRICPLAHCVAHIVVVVVPPSVTTDVVVHTWPVAHAVVQLPKYRGSDVRSTHPVPHSVSPVAQPHIPWPHTFPCGQTLPQDPQLLGSVRVLMQPPAHSVAPPVHIVAAVHTPPMQT